MTHLFSRFALMSGNFIVGICVMAPAGMLGELSQGLGVTIRDAGLLITYGAVVLCLGSPIVSWLTTRIGRRLLMSWTLAFVAAGHFATAAVDSYAAVLALRLLTVAFVAVYTPQAASTISLIVPEKDRPGAISFVFIGWSLAVAAGLPLITLVATQFGWRETYFAIGLLAAASAVLNAAALPSKLQGYPLSLGSFASIARNWVLLLILLITLLQMCGQFSITVYMAPLLSKLAGAGPGAAGAFFGLLGVAGLTGNLIATSFVARLGVQRVLTIFIVTMMLGALIWTVGAGSLPAMGAGVAMIGLGLAAANTMQQARLVEEAPELASATVALNTSILYFGQALGSAIAAALYVNEFYRTMGVVSVGFFLAALLTFLLTRK